MVSIACSMAPVAHVSLFRSVVILSLSIALSLSISSRLPEPLVKGSGRVEWLGLLGVLSSNRNLTLVIHLSYEVLHLNQTLTGLNRLL